MNIKRYFAPDMRRAINQVRDEHGPDTVILSSATVEGGVEVIVAADYDATLMSELGTMSQAASLFGAAGRDGDSDSRDETATDPETDTETQADSEASVLRETDADRESSDSRDSQAAVGGPGAEPETGIAAEADAVAEADTVADVDTVAKADAVADVDTVAEAVAVARESSAADPDADRVAPAEQADAAGHDPLRDPATGALLESRAADDGIRNNDVEITAAKLVETGPRVPALRQDADASRELRAIHEDLFALKGLMRERFAWSDLRARTPERCWLMRRAEEFGLTARLADTLLSEVEHPAVDERAWTELVAALRRRLLVVRNDPIDEPGVIMLTGPTGVGKTTTIAKLAARCSLRYGRDSVTMISTDFDRIGAQRQLAAYGAMLGVPVHTVGSAAGLDDLIRELGDRRLVLIDTSGSAQGSRGVAALADQIAARVSLRRFLVLAANLEAGVMHDAVDAFGGSALDGIVVTKIDEAARLGGAVSVLVGAGLPAVWLSDGQRIPEDLRLATVDDLLESAAQVTDSVTDPQVPAFGLHTTDQFAAECADDRKS